MQRRIVFALLAIVVIVVMIAKPRIPVSVTESTRSVFAQIESLDSGSVVMLSFDHEASSLPEIGPIGAAIGARLRGPRAGGSDRQLASEVDQLRVRLGEVEERLDFAERLLTRGGEVDQIPGGAQR